LNVSVKRLVHHGGKARAFPMGLHDVLVGRYSCAVGGMGRNSSQMVYKNQVTILYLMVITALLSGGYVQLIRAAQGMLNTFRKCFSGGCYVKPLPVKASYFVRGLHPP